MRLYNTLGRQLQEFKPIDDNRVKLYTCGPTVYDYAQIGNLRTFVFYDTLKRALSASGYEVKHVMNITDVGHLVSDGDEGEDKLEKGAAREGKTVWQVAEMYIEAFKADAKAVNVLTDTSPQLARATDYISSQVNMVGLLVEKGYAYITDQAIYFDVSKLDDYGKLTGQKLADKEVAVRPEVKSDDSKRNPQDFAIWFFLAGHYQHHEMHWPSPWGDGFPGWHLECSAIIHELLGEPIDIHTGAVDLIGTHHTNEIAQTEAAFDKKLANFWVHGEHLLVNGEKMSKSTGNFITLKQVTDKGFDPLALRLLFLQSHYRSQMNFTWEALEAAQSWLSSLKALPALRYQAKPGGGNPIGQADLENLPTYLENDLDTPGALAEVASVASRSGAALFNEDSVSYLHQYIDLLDQLFGLDLAKVKDITDVQKHTIAKREQARQSGDFSEADKLRDELTKDNIEVRDTELGPIWSYKA